MIPRIDNRMYSNVILTVIAMVLVAMAVQQAGVNVVSNANAQLTSNRNIDKTGTGVIIDANIPQTQDVAVAAATSEVAASNREIAAAIKELALAVRDGSSDIKSMVGRSASPAPVSTSGAAPAEPSARPTIEVR